MKSLLKNTLLSVCALGLLAGCASKDVEYDDSTVASNVDQRIDEVAVSDESTMVTSSINQNMTDANDRLQKITNSSVNTVKSDVDGKVVLLESVHFAFDKYKLNDDMREVATSNYSKIDETAQSYNDLKIKLEGNCDEWGSDEYNYALGLKRAKATKDALIADGIDEKRIVMVSFGESNPVCTQKNTACWKMNRRVDYRLLP
ncbi:peptidoglycan-associated lipoprotein Pal [Arcobacter sp. 15-2]|uniref:OmpA family protein n=1 Tax=Arcobacter sp. 15-2 TaxID=3374109 RepID=UPI00399D53AD